MKPLIVLLILGSIVPHSIAAQCPIAILQTTGSGTATRSKVGFVCGSPCPKYYLQQKTGYYFHLRQHDECRAPNYIYDFETIYENYDVVEIDPEFLADGFPAPDGCGGYNAKSTSRHVGRYLKTQQCSGTDCNENLVVASYTQDAQDVWRDSNGVAQDDPHDPGWDGTGWIEIRECDRTVLKLDVTSNSTCPNGKLSSSETTGRNGSWLDHEYTTARLTTTVDSLALARVPTTFLRGDPSSTRTLNFTEECATASRSKWRAEIHGTEPGAQYEISWIELITHTDGKQERRSRKRHTRAPNQSVWYFPSAEGELTPTAPWPKGCPENGGTSTVSIVQVAISLLHSPINPAGISSISPPGTGSAGLGAIECQSCPENSAAYLPPGVNLSIALGQMTKGGSAGHLYLSEFFPSPQLATPDLLQFSGNTDHDSGTEVIRLSGRLHQIVTAQAFVTITPLSDFAYQIHIYRPEAKGAASGSGYTVLNPSENLLTTWTIENPDASPAVFDRLRITESPLTGTSRVWLYTYHPSDNAWLLVTPSDLANEWLVQSTHPASQTRTETLQRINPNGGGIAHQLTRIYRTHSWGDALVTEITGAGAAARTIQWTYYPDAASAGYNAVSSRPPIKTITRWDGSWEHYPAYDTQGRPLTVLRGFDAALTSDPASAIATHYSYLPVDPADTGAVTPMAPRKVIETFKGTPISLTYWVFTPSETRQIRCPSSSSAFNSSGNLSTITRYFLSGNNAGRTQSIEHPDGTMIFYDCAEAGSSRSVTVSSGQPNSTKTAILNGSQTITHTGALGQIVSVEKKEIINGTPGVVLETQTHSDFDSFGRAQRISYLDGTSEQIFYACCGIDRIVDRDGTPTQYIYDAVKRQIGVVQTGITVHRVLNASGQILQSVRIGTDGSQVVLEQAAYNSAGQIIAQTNALNGVTTFAEGHSDGLRTRTRTNPNGGTITELFYRDGRLAKTTGTAARPVRYEYFVEIDEGAPRLVKKEIKLNSSYADTPEWTKTFHDHFGRPYKTMFAAPAAPYPYHQAYFNAAGQLWKEIDPDGVRTLYQYNPKGELEVTAIDLNRNDAIDFGGIDRITQTVSDVVANHGIHVRRTRLFVWHTDYSSTSTLHSTSETAVDGLRTWFTSGGTTQRSEQSFDGNGNRYQTRYAPNGASTVSHFQNGRLQSITWRDAAGTQIGRQSFSYDSHGRQHAVTDARNGTTAFTFNHADQIITTTSPPPGSGQTPQITSAVYNNMLHVTRVTLPDSSAVHAEYHPTGDLKKVWGSHVYPVEYTYDAQGRTRTMTTWQNYDMNSGEFITTWAYDPYRGFLTQKRDAYHYGPTYSYKPSGRLLSRTWARNVVSTYSYSDAGDLQTVSYSDGLTPAVNYNYDRRGRLRTAAYNGITTSLVYNNADQLIAESHSGGLLSGFAVNRAFDAFLRPQSVALNTHSSTLNSYAYDSASRLQTVSDGTFSAQYSYPGNSPIVSEIGFRHGSQIRLTSTRQIDNLNRTISITHSPSGSLPRSYAYQYNSLDQPTRLTLEDGSSWHYTYDSLGQVNSGKKYWTDSSPVSGQQFEYAFDDIGNRSSTRSGGNAATGMRFASYSTDGVNRYNNRTVPANFDLLGVADPAGTVLVNGQPTERRGDYYHAALGAINSSSPDYKPVTVSMGGATVAGSVFVAQTPESFSHDSDGNLISDGRWTYQWDAENRLLRMESWSSAPESSKRLLSFAYDYLGRRIQKIVYRRSGGSWILISNTKYIYDGWNLLAEIDGSANTLIRSYLWGLDLNSAPGRLGSAGALLGIKDSNGVMHFCAYDGNGNLMALVNATTGNPSADYAYGPFGEPIRVTGAMGAANPLRWSTKYTDTETGLVYYGYRYYNPATGRWISRDPIGEAGGLNLYGFTGNEPTRAVDTLGLACGDEWDPRTKFYRAKGFILGGWDQIESLWAMITDLPGTASGAYQAARNYDQTLEIIRRAARDAVDEYIQSKTGCIDPCIALEMEGKIASEIATMFVGLGTLTKATKLDTLSRLTKLKTAERLTSLANDSCCEVAEPSVQLEFEFVDFVERQTLAKKFYVTETGWNDRQITSHLKGIDYNKPVEIVEIPMGTVLTQHRFPGDPTGNYFSIPGTPAKGLGIYPHGRVEARYEAATDLRALRSIAADMTDTWSVPGWAIGVPGGNLQLFVPNKNQLRRR